MTQGLRRRETGWRSIVAMMALTCAVVPAVAAAPAAKELDQVPMVTIPAGAFLMGNPEGKGRADEWPQRSVYLDEFAIDQVEVTNERYLAFVATTGHRSPPNPYGTGPLVSVKGIEQLPVVQATWYDAKAYCSWAKKRLPRKRNGRRPLVAPMAVSFPGAMNQQHRSGRTSTVSGRKRKHYIRSGPCQAATHPTA